MFHILKAGIEMILKVNYCSNYVHNTLVIFQWSSPSQQFNEP